MSKEVKICAVSDLHGYLPKIPKCDIVCICGDIVPLDIQRDTIKSVAWLGGVFQEWCRNLPCKKILMVWGNHDFVGEYLYNFGSSFSSTNSTQWCRMLNGEDQHNILFMRDLKNKITILQDESIEVLGLKFYGTPWCPELRNWAFYGDSSDLHSKFGKIPEDVDVILSHCPPNFNTQGVVLQNNWNYMKNFGSRELQGVIYNKLTNKTTPTMILSGHVHSGNHETESSGLVSYTNVSILDEDYEPNYKPFEFTMTPCKNS